MVNFNNSDFYTTWAGMFSTNKQWIHPERIESTYELIYVLNGTIYIRENDTDYVLTKKNLFLLDANKKHIGFKYSSGITEFLWAHFYIDDISSLPPLKKVIFNFSEGHLFKEYLHLYYTPNYPKELLDISLLNIISKIIEKPSCTSSNADSKLATEIYEWLRINSLTKPNSDTVAKHFGYNAEYISRVLKKYYNSTLNETVNLFIVNEANNLLSNTNYSVKEIASVLNFDDANLFSKFYKYHTDNTPTQYRNSHIRIQINNA